MSDEVLDLLTRRFAQGPRAAEIDRVGLHPLRVQLMLTDELTQAVANAGAVAVSVSVANMAIAATAIGVFWLKFSYRTLRRASSIKGTDLFDRADADTVCFPQSSVDGSRLSHAHFGSMHEPGNVGRIGVTKSHKPTA